MSAKVKSLAGLDGFVIFNEDGQIIESDISEEFLHEHTGYTIKDIIANGARLIGDLQTTVLLTEKGAWYLSKNSKKYLIVLAGNSQPVDIPELIKLADNIKSEMS